VDQKKTAREQYTHAGEEQTKRSNIMQKSRDFPVTLPELGEPSD
jgi:hypothetical protein